MSKNNELELLVDIERVCRDSDFMPAFYMPKIDAIRNALVNANKERDLFESKYHCPLSVLEEAHDSGKIFSVWLDDYIDVFQIVLWEQATRPYILCKYRRKRSKKIEEKLIFVDEYQKTWYLKKEGKHE